MTEFTNTLLNLLRLIPTGDNSQQFRFQLDQNGLSIYHDKKIAEHRFNQSSVASLLSLGMIVEVISNYSADNQMGCQFEFAQNFQDADLWLKVSFASDNYIKNLEKNSKHLQLLEDRKTFRGFFKKKSFDFEAMNKEFQGQVIFIPKLLQSTYNLAWKMENMVFDDYQAFKNIVKWFRYSEHDLLKTKTGMSLTNLNMDILNGSLIRLMNKAEVLGKLFSPYFKMLNLLKVHVLYRQSIGFGLVTMDGSDDQSIIRAGRAILKVWLKLTDLNMAIQPISSASLLPFQYVHRNGAFLEKYKLALSRAEDMLKGQFKYKNGSGIWLFRFGVPDKTVHKKNQRSLRLDVSELLVNRK